MDYTQGPWTYAGYVAMHGGLCITAKRNAVAVLSNKRNEGEGNARLVVAAVNACQEVNAENPLAVAESIKEMYEALKYVINADDSVSPEIAAVANKALAKAEGK